MSVYNPVGDDGGLTPLIWRAAYCSGPASRHDWPAVRQLYRSPPPRHHPCRRRRRRHKLRRNWD